MRQEPTMSDDTETVATRLWRDRVQIREQERNDALARARIAEEKVAILLAENDRLSAEIDRLRAQLSPGAELVRDETMQQMQALKGALLPLLSEQPTRHLNA
jgi:regulator of replication initiation timing